MPRTVVVGVDGSPESLAAADWAAREAVLRTAELRVVYAGEQPPYAYVPFAGETVPPPGADRSAHMLREVDAALTHRHRGLRITTDQVDGHPATALPIAAREADLLVLGSRGLSGVAGLLLGSVAPAVVARSRRPVVLVRAGERAEDEHVSDASGNRSESTPFRDVVLGLDLRDPHDAVIEFAFEAASRRAAALRIIHSWSPSGNDDGDTLDAELRGEPASLTDALAPWRDKYPGVEVTEQVVVGAPGSHLADASRDAALVVVGRRRRPSTVGPRIGPVTHAVLHDAVAPVAVIPHD
ncbi:universal stress protein [Streptomyces sp. 15-116A]|uniref:universal stress protein n=1 Tax=Streptomyces sp. 15-116A TaxID=2259035 RepID=UPI0021B345F2|nr:universal stress protein [Streptomyces sp. 15-116A]MCT7353865.1 universal stress protein [Streptomyces sp. 15-116A]